MHFVETWTSLTKLSADWSSFRNSSRTAKGKLT